MRSEGGAPMGVFSRVMIVMLITLIAAVLIAVSAFRSNGGRLENTAATPSGSAKKEINPFRP